ncbi:hypothetical protein, partial [Tessaracoccus sp.]
MHEPGMRHDVRMGNNVVLLRMGLDVVPPETWQGEPINPLGLAILAILLHGFTCLCTYRSVVSPRQAGGQAGGAPDLPVAAIKHSGLGSPIRVDLTGIGHPQSFDGTGLNWGSAPDGTVCSGFHQRTPPHP